MGMADRRSSYHRQELVTKIALTASFNAELKQAVEKS
jgi:hypothetical protein